MQDLPTSNGPGSSSEPGSSIGLPSSNGSPANERPRPPGSPTSQTPASSAPGQQAPQQYQPPVSFYTTGGTLPVGAPSYVERQADRDLHQALTGGDYCYVLTSRQMGKSSLMIHTATRLRQEGVRVAILDLTAIGQNLTPEQWYGGLARRLGRQLDLEDELDDFWEDHPQMGPVERFFRCLEDIVLPQLHQQSPLNNPTTQPPHNTGTQPPNHPGTQEPRNPITQEPEIPFTFPSLVVFVDEIDAVRSLPFSADEFFGGIRECFNRRTQDPLFYSLAFCLLGVATPADLISDTRTSPFNIGRRIELRDFTATEAAPLARGFGYGGMEVWEYGSRPSYGGADDQNAGDGNPGEITNQKPAVHSTELLERVLYWTGGQPFLTQRLCRAVVEDLNLRLSAAAAQSSDTPTLPHIQTSILPYSHTSTPPYQTVDRLCSELFLTRSAREADDNLTFVRNRLLRSEVDLAGLLDLFQRVLQSVRRFGGKQIRDDETNPMVSVLKLSGVVSVDNGVLKVRNRIYRQVFDREWVLAHMPDAELRRQKMAYRRGFERAAVLFTAMLLLVSGLAQATHVQALRADNNAIAAQKSEQRALASAREAESNARDARTAKARAEKLATDARKLADQRAVALKDRDTALAQLQHSLLLTNQARGQAAREAQSARLSENHANREAEAARLAERHASSEAEAVKLALGRVESAKQQADRSAGIARTQEHLAQLSTLREHAAADRALDLLSLNQLQRGIQQIDEGRPAGLLNLLESSRAVQSLPGANLARSQIWSAWYPQVAGRLVQMVAQKQMAVSSAYSPDGRYVATLALDGLRLCDVESGRLHESLPGSSNLAPDASMMAVTFSFPPPPFFSPDGRQLFLLQNNGLRGWEVASGKQLSWNIRQPGLAAAGFRPDGTLYTVGAPKAVEHESGPQGASGQNAIALTSGQGSDVAIVIQKWNPATGKALDTPVQLKNDPGKPKSTTTSYFGSLLSVSLSQDGEWAAIREPTGAIQVWNTETGRARSAAIHPEDYSLSFALSPDGSKLATADISMLHFWDTDTGQMERSMPASAMAALAFSQDGRLLASGSLDGAAQVWRVDTGERLGPVMQHPGSVSLVAFRPDGKQLVTASSDAQIRIWRVAPDPTPGQVISLQTPSDMAFSPNGRLLAFSSATGIEIRNLARMDRPLILDSRLNYSPALVFSEDGTLLAASFGKEARLWESATGKLHTTLTCPKENNIFRMMFSPGGATLAARLSDGNMLLWDTRTGRLLGQRRFIEPIAFGSTPLDGITNGNGSFSRDGRLVIVGGPDASPVLVKTDSLQPVGKPFGSPAVRAASFTPDGRFLVTMEPSLIRIAAFNSGTLRNGFVPRLVQMRKIKPPGMVALLLFSPDGRMLVVGTVDPLNPLGRSVIKVLEIETGRTLMTINGSLLGAGQPVLFTPDSRIIATSGLDGIVLMWNSRTGERYGPPLNLNGLGVVIAINHDGSLVASQSVNGEMRLWDSSTAQPFGPPLRRWRPLRNQEVFRTTGFSPDGKWFAALTSDGMHIIRTDLPRASMKEMQTLTWAAVGVRMDPQGTVTGIPSDEWRRLHATAAAMGARHGPSLQFAALAANGASGPSPESSASSTQAVPAPSLADFRKRIPARDPVAPAGTIDLTSEYTAALSDNWHHGYDDNTLAELPHGVQQFAGTSFDVRGIVQLSGLSLSGNIGHYPKDANGISIQRAFHRLYVLHATAFSTPEKTTVGKFILHYANGYLLEIPIVYGQDVSDWWDQTPLQSATTQVAWTGSNPAAAARNEHLQLYKTTWENPYPTSPVESIDYVSSMAQPAPFMIGMTVE